MFMHIYLVVAHITIVFYIGSSFANIEEEQYGVKFATNCEVCKLVTKEINEKLIARDSSEIIETGYNLDYSKKKRKYKHSELRILEVLEETCDGMVDYRVHKERHDSTRWAKSMSQTFKTLHGLVEKGVKVELGIPKELWDEPSAETAQLKTQCEQFLEDNEELINDWYFSEQKELLQREVCHKVLKETQCLSEPYGEQIKATEKKKSKGDRAKREL